MFGETWEEITDFNGLTTPAFHNVVTLHLNFEESISFPPLRKRTKIRLSQVLFKNYVDVLLSCIYVYPLNTFCWQRLEEAIWSSGLGVTDKLWLSMCILGTEYVSSACAASALNHRDISPDPQILLTWLLNMNFTSFMFLRIWGVVSAMEVSVYERSAKASLGKYLEVFHFGNIFHYFCQKNVMNEILIYNA